MGYNLNFNGDEKNRFEPKSNLNKGGHVAQHGPHIQLKLMLGQKRNYGKKNPIFLVLIKKERERRRYKEESQAFLPRSIEFCWSVFVEPRT